MNNGAGLSRSNQAKRWAANRRTSRGHGRQKVAQQTRIAADRIMRGWKSDGDASRWRRAPAAAPPAALWRGPPAALGTALADRRAGI